MSIRAGGAVAAAAFLIATGLAVPGKPVADVLPTPADTSTTGGTTTARRSPCPAPRCSARARRTHPDEERGQREESAALAQTADLESVYSSDPSDTRWALIEPTLTTWREFAARPQTHQKVDVGRTARCVQPDPYVNRTEHLGNLPHDSRTQWQPDRLNHAREDRNPQPTAFEIDTQSVKTPPPYL